MISRTRVTFAIVAPVAVVAIAIPAGAQCPGEWTSLVARTGFDHPSGVNGLIEWDRGAGPEVYAYGFFKEAGGVEVNSIARWDGDRWHSLDGGVTEPPGVASHINAAIVASLGGKDVLVVGGTFQAAGGVPALGVAMNDGTGWQSLGDGLQQAAHGGEVHALAIYDDGSGPALYAGGDFGFSGFTILNNIARWDGAAWRPLEFFETGVDGLIREMIAFDDGAGPKLVVAGSLTTVGGMPVQGIAAWDGDVWSRYGDGVASVGDLEILQGVLYGVMSSSAGDFAHWDGEAWRRAGGATVDRSGPMYAVDDPMAPRLYIGATMREGGDLSVPAVWDGEALSWSSLPGGESLSRDDWVSGMLVREGSDELWISGQFDQAGPHPVEEIAIFEGEGFRPLGEEFNGRILDIVSQRENGADAVYLAGDFTWGGGREAFGVIRYAEGEWQPLGDGFDATVHALASFDDGTGPSIYAAGDFTASGDRAVPGIARWNGDQWEAVAGGIPGGEHMGVRDLVVHDDGAGPALYASGFFTQAGGIFANRVARWDGAEWSALGRGLDGVGFAMASYMTGTGPALCVGGDFTRAGGLAGVDASNIACWDGASWSALGEGANDTVRTIGALIDSGGSHLIASGEFTIIGGKPIQGMARWDGAAWSEVDGMTGAADVFKAVEIDGEPMLAVGGTFSMAGPIDANGAALWSSTRGWSALGEGVQWRQGGGPVFAIEPVGAAIWFGGDFTIAGDEPAGRVAMWTPSCECYADCDGSGSLDFFDFLCFQNQFAAGEPEADCDGSGELDFFDFLCFQNEFAGGCS